MNIRKVIEGFSEIGVTLNSVAQSLRNTFSSRYDLQPQRVIHITERFDAVSNVPYRTGFDAWRQ
jgi:hypothetical protein